MDPSGSEQAVAARASTKRDLVVGVLRDTDDFRSAQEIHDVLLHDGLKVGLATIYRTLQSLSTAGEVDVLRNDNGEATYRRCSESHHHHLVCRICGRVVEVEGPTVERWATSVAQQHGFRDVSHTLEVFGVCADH